MPLKPSILTLCCGAVLAVFTVRANAAPLVITQVNSLTLPSNATDQNGQPFTVTGMSGIVRFFNGIFAAVMDNSNKVVRFDLTIDSSAGGISAPTLVPGLSLDLSRDFEGIALTPFGFGNAAILLSDEGIAGASPPEITGWELVTGSLASPPLVTPAVYSAIRPNFGFESLTAGVGRAGLNEVWTANEEALTVDGPLSTAAVGTVVRLQRYVAAGPSVQFAYTCDPWHGTAVSGARSGLSDLCLLPDGRLIALERSFAFNASGFFRTRIYEVDSSTATDVSTIPALTAGGYTPAAKTLLFSGFLQNVEGLCIGPALDAPGVYSLIAVTDDADPISNNTLYAFRIAGVGPPPCIADLNLDGSRNTADLTAFLGAFGRSGPPGFIAADLNGDGTINTADLVTFLGRFGVPCP